MIEKYNHYLKYLKILLLIFMLSQYTFGVKNDTKKYQLLSKEEIKYLEKHPELIVLNKSGLPPYTFIEGGEYKGFWIDVLDIMFEGLDVKLIHDDRKRSYGYKNYLDEEKAHILTSMLYTPERLEAMRFAKPEVLISYPAIIMRTTEQAVRDIKKLKNMRVALPSGHFFEKKLIREVPEVEIVAVDSFVAALEAVSYGFADATLQDIAIATYWSQKRKLPNLRPTGPAVLPDMKNQLVAITVAKNNEVLQNILFKLAGRISSYEMKKLREKWFLSSTDLKVSTTKTLFITDDEREYLSNLEEIKISVDPSWLPYEHIDKNEEYIGIVADFIDLISKKLDVKFVLQNTETWKESLSEFRNGESDIIPAIVPTPSRREWMEFSQTYMVFPLVVAVSSDELFVEGLEAIKDKKLGVIKSYPYDELLRKRFSEINIVQVENINEGLKMVRSGELYGYVDTIASIGYSIKKNNLIDIKIGGKLDVDLKLSMAVKKGENSQLLEILNKTIESISEMEKTELKDKWFSVIYEQETDYDLIIKIITASIIILIVIMVWNRKLVNLNKQLAKAKSEVERLSNTDSLTSLSNRRCLDDTLEKEINRSERYQTSFSLMIIDIDFFKSVNDDYGHDVGDDFLVAFSNILKSSVRKSDVVGRWGGEEFLIICPETSLEQASKLAEILREKIASGTFPIEGNKTASFGVGAYKEGDTRASIIKRIDKALYKAKTNGRNQVEVVEN